MKSFFALLLFSFALDRCYAGTTIDPVNKYAHGANIGWMDWSGGAGETAYGVFIGNEYCSGYIYSANTGWVNLGNGTPLNGTSYSQSASDFGVNILNGVYLVGYAWGANIGWINFGINYPAATSPPVMSMATGQLSGYAWSANCGWINLDSTYNGTSYGVVGLNTLSVSVTPATTTVTLNGIPGATYQLQYAQKITGPWFNLTSDVVAPPNGIIQASFPTDPADPTLFFRAVLVAAP